MKRTGYLSCSNDSLNKLFSNIIWGQKGASDETFIASAFYAYSTSLVIKAGNCFYSEQK